MRQLKVTYVSKQYNEIATLITNLGAINPVIITHRGYIYYPKTSNEKLSNQII